MYRPISFYVGQWTRLPEPPSGPLLAGKTVIITGANTGLGFESALHFAACSPALLVLAVRNLASGAEALEKILRKFPKVKVQVWSLDLGKYASVKAFAARAEKELDQVDILVNNAGQFPGFAMKPMQKTEDGHEQTMQINLLSPLLLSLLLQPLLTRSPDPRLTMVSSEVHVWARTVLFANAVAKGERILDAFDDEAVFVNPPRYFETKLLLQMVVRKLIQALPNIIVTSANPGLCQTNLVRDPPKFSLSRIPDILWSRLNVRSAESGARNTTTAALLAKESAEYWDCCEPGASRSTFLGSLTGLKATEQVWKEVLDEMEKVAPGCTASLQL